MVSTAQLSLARLRLCACVPVSPPPPLHPRCPSPSRCRPRSILFPFPLRPKTFPGGSPGGARCCRGPAASFAFLSLFFTEVAFLSLLPGTRCAPPAPHLPGPPGALPSPGPGSVASRQPWPGPGRGCGGEVLGVFVFVVSCVGCFLFHFVPLLSPGVSPVQVAGQVPALCK